MKKYEQYGMLFILVLILLSSFLTSISALSVAIGGVVLLAFFLLNQKIWKQLTIGEMIGLVLLFIGVIGLTVLVIFYIAQPVIQSFDNSFTQLLLKLISTIFILTIAVNTFERFSLKITSGKFPLRMQEDNGEEEEIGHEG